MPPPTMIENGDPLRPSLFTVSVTLLAPVAPIEE